MPDIDLTSPYYRLVQLSWQHQTMLEAMTGKGYDREHTRANLRYLDKQRQIIHDQIIAELDRLHIPTADRQDALDKAQRIAWWFREP